MVKSTPKVRRHGSDKNSICKWALVALARGRSSDELEVAWAWGGRAPRGGEGGEF
jgi:hypothetical protein